MGIITWLQGKKTYIVAIVIGVKAVMVHMGIEFPLWIDQLLIALGITTIRAAIKKSEA